MKAHRPGAGVKQKSNGRDPSAPELPPAAPPAAPPQPSSETTRPGAQDVASTDSSWRGGQTRDLNTVPLSGEVANWYEYVPREPMWLITCAAGVQSSTVHPEDNHLGLVPWWRGPNAVDSLIERINVGYRYGARWFFINRPMGALGTTYVPGGTWLSLSEEKREELPRKLTNALLDYFEEPVHIVWFVGSDLDDPRSIVGWTPDRDQHYFRLGANQTYEQTIASRVTLGGWLSTGAAGIAIDNSAPPHKRETYISMFHQLIRAPFSTLVFGEALPLVYQGNRLQTHSDGTFKLDMEALGRMPWLATDSLMNTWFGSHFAPGMVSLDPEKTRVYVWYLESNQVMSVAHREQLIDRWVDRGLIPIVADPVMFRRARARLLE